MVGDWNDSLVRWNPYYFIYKARFNPKFIISNSTGIAKAEFFLNGVLIGTITAAPWEYTGQCDVTPFHHSNTVGIKVYDYFGNQSSDNITIYRLFL